MKPITQNKHTQLKKGNPFRRRWYPGRAKSKPVGTRQELASLIFDLLLDQVEVNEAEQRIRHAALSPMEATDAIGKYRLAAGCTGKAVTL